MAGHYIELEDADGNTVRCPATSLVKGECQTCCQVFYTESRIGEMRCPHCGGAVDWVWGQAPRLAFVAESSSRFSSLPPPAADDEETA